MNTLYIALPRIPHQPFRRRHILAQLRHAGVMRKIHIPRLTVAVLRHDYHTQTLRRYLLTGSVLIPASAGR